MVQSIEEHRKKNRENMAKKRAAIKKAAKQGDEKAQNIIENNRKYQRKAYQQLKTKAENGDKQAQIKLDNKKHNDYINVAKYHIKKAEIKQLDEFEALIDKRIAELEAK